MLDKTHFFEKYKMEDEFEKSDFRWDTLEAIYEDYTSPKEEERILQSVKDLEKYIWTHMKETEAEVHSIRCRRKAPEHLLEKIIRKCVKEQSKKYRDIGVHNYKEIVRDLIGVRILTLAKEDWEGVHDAVIKMFPASEQNCPNTCIMAELPIAYTRYGDRNIFKGKIRAEHTNKGYRSQHYVVQFHGYYCEIQVRTLAEEVYGEFDHKVKYPYRNNNRFLRRYTNTLSQLLASVDELISICFQMDAEGWEQNSRYYVDDEYIDWRKIAQPIADKEQKKRQDRSYDSLPDKIEIGAYANPIILRKG